MWQREGREQRPKIVLFGVVVSLCFGLSFLFYVFEPKVNNLVDSIYTIIMTITAIGLYDLVPSSAFSKLYLIGGVVVGTQLLGIVEEEQRKFLESYARKYHITYNGLLAVVYVATVSVGIVLCSLINDPGLPNNLSDKLYFSCILGTSLGSGTFSPHTHVGKIYVAIYSLLSINVWTLVGKTFVKSFVISFLRTGFFSMMTAPQRRTLKYEGAKNV